VIKNFVQPPIGEEVTSARVRSLLPTGRTLPADAWQRRHRWLLALLWAHAVVMPFYALSQGYSPGHAVLHTLPLALLAVLATPTWHNRRINSAIVAIGLLTASAVLVHTSHGVTEAHFHFFVVVVVLSLYEDWLPFLLAVAYVVVHHGVGGTIAADAVFQHPADEAWKWALIHGAFVLAAGAGSVVAWRLNEDVRVVARRSQARFRHSFENAPVGMALADDGGHFLAVNESLCEIMGYERADLVGRNFAELIHPDELQAATEVLAALASGVQETFAGEFRYVHKAGHEIVVAVRAARQEEASGVDFVAHFEDVTERHRSEQRARHHRRHQEIVVTLGQRALSRVPLDELFDEAVELVADGLEVSHVRILRLVEEDGPLHPAAQVGWAAGDTTGLAGTTGRSVVDYLALGPLIIDYATTEWRQALAGYIELGLHASVSVAIEHDGDAYGALSVHSTTRRTFDDDDAGFLQAVANVLAGAISAERSQDELRHQSLHDPLVGLPNRMLFLDRLEHALARSQRTGAPLAVMFLDLDQFKLVNDSLGHEAGDQLLKALVPRMGEALRANDTLARFGGDEFVVLCEDLAERDEALRIAARLRGAFAAPIEIAGQRHHVSASIGVALSGAAYFGRPEALVRDADAAMYRAKAQGRDRAELFDDAMRTEIVDRLQVERDLRRALDEGELRLHYQPVIALENRELTRCEALVRWQHPLRGMLSPDQFIPVAEETGLVVPLGEWVIDEACRQLAAWDAEGLHVSVGVNLSALQIGQPDLPVVVERALHRHGIEPRRLVCEITETALIADPEGAAQTLHRLAAIGVFVSLDDFGTGYSSLASLKRFPLDAIKLDRSFIRDLKPGTRDAAIVRSLVEMARSLRIRTVAEGVETTEQLDQLVELGCDLAQGYLFAPPLSPEDFAAHLQLTAAR
jgi:diguanylate cyclase (GGDEF)-like protein/PAS domain S-box-containing protein